MEMLWHALTEKYFYVSRNEQRAHKKEIENSKYEDTGLSSVVIEENGHMHRYFAGKYRKFTYRKK